MSSVAGIDLPRRLRSSWRLSRLPNGLGYHQSLLPISVTACIHVTWMALPLSGTSPDVFVRVLSVVFTALAFFMHQLWCSLIVRCTCIQIPRQQITTLLNCIKSFRTLIVNVSVACRCFFWPCLHVNSAASGWQY